MRVVLDTNIVVSALLSPHGAPAQLLRMALRGDLAALHDDRIVAEYREVLSRPQFGFDPEAIGAVVGQAERTGEPVLAHPLLIDLPDPDDLPFLEVALAGNAHALVTGNPRHYRPIQGGHEVEIVSAADLVAAIARQRG